MIDPCFTEEELTQKKAEQIAAALVKVKELIKDWDSSLCPVVR